MLKARGLLMGTLGPQVVTPSTVQQSGPASASHPQTGKAVIDQRPKRTWSPGKSEKVTTIGAAPGIPRHKGHARANRFAAVFEFRIKVMPLRTRRLEFDLQSVQQMRREIVKWRESLRVSHARIGFWRRSRSPPFVSAHTFR